MYSHQPVLQRARRSSDDEAVSNTKGDTSYARSPTQASFHHSPRARSHSKPSTPLHPPSTFNGILNSPSSPHATLPPLATTVQPRDPPASNYYDPTQDAGDRVIGRGGAPYEPFGHDRGESYGNHGEARTAVPGVYEKPYPPQQSPVISHFPSSRRSPSHPSAHSFTPARQDAMAAQSPISPRPYVQTNFAQSQPPYIQHDRRSPVEKTPSRPADPMSISSLMSNEDTPVHRNVSHSRRSSRASNGHTVLKQERPPSPPSKSVPPTHHVQVVPPAPASVNGDVHEPVQPLSYSRSRADGREVDLELARIDAEGDSDLEADARIRWRQDYVERGIKRTLALAKGEEEKRKRRRTYNERRAQLVLENIAAKAADEFRRAHESAAWAEVQAKEIADEKERKKDMQRKRRREKTRQNELEKRQDILQRLEDPNLDEEERLKLEREAIKHEKKLRHTNHLLGNAPSDDIREVTPLGHNLEGGTMSTFQMDEASSSRRGRGGRAGTRPRKSKEQKQAEKEQAAAAQAAIDRGEDLPTIAPKESARLDKLTHADREQSLTEESAAPEFVPYTSKAYNQLYESIWKEIAQNVKKVYRIKKESLEVRQSNLRKTAQLASKEARRWQLRTNKSTKDVQARAKRGMREMATFWRRNEKDESARQKDAIRQELENAKRAEAEREANRQRRKLNFLISQTELYSHFVGRKVKTAEAEKSGDVEADQSTVTAGKPDLPEGLTSGPAGPKVTNFDELDFDAEDDSQLRAAAAANARHAVEEARRTAQAFNGDGEQQQNLQAQFDEGEMNFQNPTSLQSMDVAQPKMLSCQLKEYQLKGLNWLVNLYEQGINGILADEMGLGKTVQSISVMAYLAETHNVWGPFLVIAPASTLHNWQQEITKFVPSMKALPYWGTAKDRKILRKFWDRRSVVYREDADFHVLITSYQLVVQDAQYFQKMKWQYMILDEAQAIKSSQSSRWKSLLSFHCRNRLLLTGTPIQNNMQELWALLHFIMPTLFDSHDEFSDWFSKDIESHAQSNTKLNEDQLKRLHMILKPFMLRRVKKHVQKELGDKVELDVFCDLTYRQRAYYTSLRNKISIMDLIEKAAMGDDQDSATLMNLVMQFRKVCNHPDLFERAEVSSPYSFGYFAETESFVREGSNVQVAYSVRNLIEYNLPRLMYKDGGRLDIPSYSNTAAGWRGRYLDHLMNIWSSNHIHESAKNDDHFSWLRFADMSATEAEFAARNGVFERAVDMRRKRRDVSTFEILYDGTDGDDYTPVHALFQIADKKARKPLAEVTNEGYMSNLLNISQNVYENSVFPVMETGYRPAVTAPPIEIYCSNQAHITERQSTLFNNLVQSALFGISEKTEEALIEAKVDPADYPVFGMLPAPTKRKARFTHIEVPSMRKFVTDCGKLAKLDQLLRELKENGHRVLLYFQMTRMIDLMEEYLTYRNYKYCRLDGSTKLEDRRDTVADFQTRPEIFVFLLSTRAGGLGINLTSADTVIFYDSDWNPTIDSQAMDRAHRLGQTKQVTVYRLITRGTIEERIRKRALQKEEVQRVVISGGAGVDFNTRSRENRTKDIAMWLADDEQAAEIEKKEQEIANDPSKAQQAKKRKAGAGGRKKELSMDDMYHEGEGNFDDNSAKPSGAATPVSAVDGPPAKRKKGISKKAKTLKQRLAVADGSADPDTFQ
ncbi:uncharacterized protein PV09_00402 [Verruconis gallopava]|uniref:Chromatin-remodeling ATPase INO80 n=1 Tax=Verruconis gallopava TaxID=253628 RepID=A0A0D1Z992_9PEZI|nr:uncharacterized protein PV09_00402 [Verruconis gallopava]KIW09527.1 hypothetical protein PV09_00402 [Verruconis gallopava]